MLKERLIAVLLGVVMMVAVLGATGIVADELGLAVTPQVQACSGGGTSGGSC